MVPRLDGKTVARDMGSLLALGKKGIAGFIIFGGEIEELRACIKRLQDAADIPLIIASDLEQGLGQQVTGGTLFPPAMAITSAAFRGGTFDPDIARKVFSCYAKEALYAGINTILAPVVDINTNPDNPIIAARSFGEDRETVSLMADIMIDVFHEYGIRSCAKHFPGHGDTAVDSHLSLPVLNKSLEDLEKYELYPFRKSVESNVDTIMLAHMAVPSLDPSKAPMSVSEKATDYIRNTLNFDGIIMTDALDMGGLSGLGEDEAGLAALNAGVDVLLHPSDADGLALFLAQSGARPITDRIELFRKGLSRGSDEPFDAGASRELSRDVSERAITVVWDWRPVRPSVIYLIIDERELSAGLIEDYFSELFPDVNQIVIREGQGSIPSNPETGAITVIYSRTAAWKGGAKNWFLEAVRSAASRSSLLIVAGNPYIAHGLNVPMIKTYWCGEQAEKALIKKLDVLLRK